MGRSSFPAERVQARSEFTRILEELIASAPGASGVALVDREGEAVDYAGSLTMFEIKVAAAHLQLETRLAAQSLLPSVGTVRSLTVRAATRSFISVELVDGYNLVVILRRCSPFGISQRALKAAERAICIEGGWPAAKDLERWSLAQVQSVRRRHGKPLRLLFGSRWLALEIMGVVAGLPDGERGYRVRTEEGAEMTLVRERMGRWFSDTALG